ncbi:MAG: histidine kinase, partial [Leptospiraceae bacterium]|nr:histidine kinase [Leptospiraceae bacterium]
MLAAILLVLGVYHLILNMIRRNPSAFWFGLFCLLFAMRSALTGEAIHKLWFPELDYRIEITLEYLAYYYSIAVFAMMLHSLFPAEFPRLLRNLFMGYSVLFSLTLLLPTEQFTGLIIGYHVAALAFIIVGTTAVGLAFKRRRASAGTFLLAALILATGSTVDILINILYHISTAYTSLGLLGFIIAQTIVIARRYAAAFQQVESLSSSLEANNAELDKKNIELTRLDRLKDEFLANTSHELRTPLHGIIGITESILQGAAGPISKPVGQNLRLVTTSGRRLSNLVNDILDFSKLQHGDLVLKRTAVDIGSMVDTVMVLSRPLVGVKDIKLINAKQDLPLVDADENRLEQILINLIGNAIKFTKEGSVTVQYSTLPDGLLEIAIVDTGIGIPEDKQELIFESFTQADGSIAREYGGTGIGLSVTRRLVELHGGTIRVNSIQGKGSTFAFTLPVAGHDLKHIDQTTENERLVAPWAEEVDEETVGEMLRANPEMEDEEVRRILIVDDDPINLQVLRN